MWIRWEKTFIQDARNDNQLQTIRMSRPKSDVFAKITTTDTGAKSQTKDIDKVTVVSRSYDVKGHAENAWNGIVNWRTCPWISS